MHRAIVLTTLAALALPTAASGKEVASLTVCGSDGCKKITTHAALQGFMNGGYETLAPKRGGAFFNVKVAMRHEGDDAGGWTVQYLRAANLIRAEADYSKHVWTRPAGVTAQALRRAARGLQPYPAEQLGPVREPSPAAVEDPPARVSRPASGDGSSQLALAGGGAGAALVLVGGALVARRRRQRPG
jgi:LPXTG-motif cell wall-anchored protein